MGETMSSDPGYTSDESTSTVDSRWIDELMKLKEEDFNFEDEVRYLEVYTYSEAEENEDVRQVKEADSAERSDISPLPPKAKFFPKPNFTPKATISSGLEQKAIEEMEESDWGE